MTWDRATLLLVMFAVSVQGYVNNRQNDSIQELMDHQCECRKRLPQIFIDENTDIPNNPLKPLTPEEFQKLQDELRKKAKP